MWQLGAAASRKVARLAICAAASAATRGAERFKLVLTHGGSIAIVLVPARLVPLAPNIAL